MSSSFEPPLNTYVPGKGGVYTSGNGISSSLQKASWKGGSWRTCPNPGTLEFFRISEQLTRLLKYECNRVFVNHADSYVGRHLIKYLGEKDFSSPIMMGDSLIPEGTMSDISVRRPTIDDMVLVGEDIMQGEGGNYIYNKDLYKGKKMSFGEECVICPEECICEVEQESSTKSESSCHESESLPCIPEFLEKLLTPEQICCLLSVEDPSKQADYFRQIILQQNNCYKPRTPTRYFICGTQKHCMSTKSEHLHELIVDRDCYLPTLLTCSTVIYDITRDPGQIEEARWALNSIVYEFENLFKKSVINFKKIKDVRKFILISSCMTWANSEKIKFMKPVSERDVKFRRSHKMWKEHKLLEQEVIKAGEKFTDVFKTYIIWSGLVYGHEEERLNFLFELGFNNAVSLPVIGMGDNKVPLIHVTDLSMIVFYTMTMLIDTPSYMFAVEKDAPTLRDITEQISRGLTTGNIFMWMEDDALPDNVKLHEDTFIMLKSNLLINPIVVHEELALPWHFPDNIIGCMPDVVEEYLVARGFCPLRIIVLGPPASGKTVISKKLADLYGLEYVHPVEALLSRITLLEKELGKQRISMEEEEFTKLDDADTSSKGSDPNAGEGEGKFEPDLEDTLVTELDNIILSMKQNEGMPEDAIMIRILKLRLEEMIVLNHGYVLDGWPETYSQAEGLFGGEETHTEVSGEDHSQASSEGGPKAKKLSKRNRESRQDDDSDAEDEEGPWGEGDFARDLLPARIPTIDPSHIIQLEAKCDDLLFKILTKKQDLEGKNESSVSLTRKMHAYMEQQDKGCEPFEFFDNNCVGKLLRFDVDRDPCPMLGSTIKTILDQVGPPRNSGAMCKYLEEYELIKQISAKKVKDDERKLQDEKDQIDQEYFTAAKNFMDQWSHFKKDIVLLETDCQHPTKISSDEFISIKIMPLLVRALIEYQNTKPKNYYAFFAEFFLTEYEHATGKKGDKEIMPAEAAHENMVFTRCVEALLEQCDLSHISFVPDAMAVVKKYKRFARAEQLSSDDQQKIPCIRGRIDIEAIRKKIIDGVQKRPDVLEKELLTLPRTDASSIGIREVLETFLITNPLWKDKLRLDGHAGDICSSLSADSLSLLWKVTRSMSAEIKRLIEVRQSCFGSQKLTDDLQAVESDTVPLSDRVMRPSMQSNSMTVSMEPTFKAATGRLSVLSEKSAGGQSNESRDGDNQTYSGLSWQSQSVLRKFQKIC